MTWGKKQDEEVLQSTLEEQNKETKYLVIQRRLKHSMMLLLLLSSKSGFDQYLHNQFQRDKVTVQNQYKIFRKFSRA